MLRRTAAALLASAALPAAGCGPAAGPAEPNAAAAQAPETPLRPGLWSIRAEERAGSAPAEAPRERRRCISPAEAADPAPELLLGEQNECRRDVFTMAGGNINGVIACSAPAPIDEVTIRLWGRYDRESWTLAADTQALGVPIATRIEARRVGECD